MGEEEYCREYPCFKIGVDHRGKKYAVFLVTSDNVFTHVPVERIREALKEIEGLERKHYREARGRDVDYIAEEILGLEILEEE